MIVLAASIVAGVDAACTAAVGEEAEVEEVGCGCTGRRGRGDSAALEIRELQ